MGGLTHVAVYTWKPGTTQEDVQAFRDGLVTLPGLIPEIQALRFGPDAGLVEGNGDFALVTELADADAYRTYAAHPAHRELIARLLVPILERRMAAQITSP